MTSDDMSLIQESPFPDDLTSSGWLDGDINQIKSQVEDTLRSQCLYDRNIRCKQNAARTGVEQVADIIITFLMLRYLEKKTSIEDIPNLIMEPVFKHIFDGYTGLNMKSDKMSVLVDFLCRLPFMVEIAASYKVVSGGFVKNGMVDRIDNAWPDFDAMIRTIRGNVTREELDFLRKNFAVLLKIQMELGHIPEDIFDLLGFPQDADKDGNIFMRSSGIEREWEQRAKQLTHTYQSWLRKMRMYKMQQLKNKKKHECEKKKQKILDLNRKCEEKLINEIKDYNSHCDGRYYEGIGTCIDGELKEEKPMCALHSCCVDALLYMFVKPLADELVAFVHCRMFDTHEIPKTREKNEKKFSFPRKGKLNDAVSYLMKKPVKGKDSNAGAAKQTLIALAFRMKRKNVILK